jgi:hypothetical protein
VFAQDGKSLYVWGNVASAEDELVWAGIGLQRIDIETGELLATELDNRQIDRVMSDGESLFVSSWGSVEQSAGGADQRFTLSRLDPLTLSVEVEREYSAWTGFVPVKL